MPTKKSFDQLTAEDKKALGKDYDKLKRARSWWESLSDVAKISIVAHEGTWLALEKLAKLKPGPTGARGGVVGGALYQFFQGAGVAHRQKELRRNPNFVALLEAFGRGGSISVAGYIITDLFKKYDAAKSGASRLQRDVKKAEAELKYKK